MLLNQIEKSRQEAFTHFVRVIKKQNAHTIKFDNDLYSYITKQGIKKTYAAFYNYGAYRNSLFYPQKAERVNTFVFVEIH